MMAPEDCPFVQKKGIHLFIASQRQGQPDFCYGCGAER